MFGEKFCFVFMRSNMHVSSCFRFSTHLNRAARKHSKALQANPAFIGGGENSVAAVSIRHVEKAKVFVVPSEQISSSAASDASSSAASDVTATAAAAAATAMDTDASGRSSTQSSLPAATATSSSSSSAGARHQEDAAQPAHVHIAKPGTVVSLSKVTFEDVGADELSELAAQTRVARICESEGLPVVAVEVTKGHVKVTGERRMAARVAFDCEATAQRAEVELTHRPEFGQGKVTVCKANQLTTRTAYRGMSLLARFSLRAVYFAISLFFPFTFVPRNAYNVCNSGSDICVYYERRDQGAL